ncbi:hypothetical protein DM01DRAFT_1008303 [Hesseltinella vesiculosa]|uniref:Uncharacterized protein n=1 Tax=Hesseltinella vesiculosa TaxID=101127 RepID=A0A1X2GXT0_9FUNG|nr:hypothetical protein DM01DRAFT_1008303 [Hesseltinella vesiculosa]
MKHLTLKQSLYWGVPLTILAGYSVTRARAHPKTHLPFITTSDVGKDKDRLALLRAEFQQRNNGLGLGDDVRRSGGGV